MPLTQQRLKQVLYYEQSTGEWTWRVTLSMRRPAGTKAGTTNNPHCKIGIDGKRYYAHRLAHLYIHGCWLAALIDHANRAGADNQWSNLRPATKSQTAANSKRRRDNTSGYKGVCWSNQRNKWFAYITVDGHRRYLGYFDNAQDAHSAYVAAARQSFGQFARAA